MEGNMFKALYTISKVDLGQLMVNSIKDNLVFMMSGRFVVLKVSQHVYLVERNEELRVS
ncbi:MAG: hypothetical protein ACXAC5_04090 [Promethearchaeota archaeon]